MKVTVEPRFRSNISARAGRRSSATSRAAWRRA